jgi:lipopolysaccharide export system protein LptC
MNGATEATLQELLDVARRQDAKLAQLIAAMRAMSAASGGGGGSGLSGLASAAAAAAGPLGLAAKAASVVAGSFNLLSDLVSGVFSAMGAILGKVVTGLANTAANLFEFAVSAAKGSAKLSEFYNAFRDLPFYLGEIASVFAKLTRYSEGLLESYLKMTNSGASFSGNLFEMAQKATQAYMSMDQFTKVVNDNSDYFATMGGNVQRGVDRFVQLQSQFMGPGSRYASAIQGLGISADEAGGYLLSMMKSGVMMSNMEQQNDQKLFAATAQYVQELDALSKITGLQRSQIAEAVAKAEADQMWKNFMESVTDPGQQAYIKAGLAQAFATGGQGAVDQFKGSVRGLDTPLTALQKSLAVASGGISVQGEDIRRGFAMAKNDLEGAIGIMTEQQVATARAAGTFAKQFGEIGQAADIAKQYNIDASINFNRILESVGGDWKKALQLAAQQQNQQAGGNAAALLNATKNIQIFGSTLMGLIITVVEPLTASLAKWGTKLTAGLPGIVAKFKDPIEAFANFMDKVLLPKIEIIGNWLGTWFSKLRTANNMTDFFSILGDAFKDAWKNISEELMPLWENTIKPGMISIFESVIDFLEPYMKGALDMLFDQLSYFIYRKTGLGTDPRIEAYDRITAEKTKDINDLKTKAESESDTTKRKALQDQIARLTNQLIAWQVAAAQAKQTTDTPLPSIRRFSEGTLGVTGKLFENFGKGEIVELHGDEAVVTPSQMSELNNASLINNLMASSQRLNTLTAEVLAVMRDNNDINRKTLTATKSLSGNLYS